MKGSDLYGRRWRVFYKRLCTLIFEFLPSVCVLLVVGLCVDIVLTGEELVSYDYRSVLYRVLCQVLLLCWYLFLMAASMALGFCRLHREQITYLYMSAALIWAHRWWDLGAVARCLAAVGAVTGAVLLSIVIYKLILVRVLRKARWIKNHRNNGTDN